MYPPNPECFHIALLGLGLGTLYAPKSTLVPCGGKLGDLHHDDNNNHVVTLGSRCGHD